MLVCLLQEDAGRAFDHIREEWLFLLLPIAATQMVSDDRMNRVVAVFASGLLLVAVASLIMALFGVQYHWPEGLVPVADSAERMRGNFTHALTFGNFAAVGSTFLIAWVLLNGKTADRRFLWLAGVAGMAGAVATIFAGSRGPLLALALGLFGLMFFISWSYRRWLFGAMVAVFLLGSYVPGIQARFTSALSWQLKPDWPGGRLFIWHKSLDMIAAEPIFGVGPGNFAGEYRIRVDERLGARYFYSHAHNDFIQAAARSGIPGALTFAFLWLTVLGLIWRGRKLGGEDPSRRGAALAAFLASIVFLASSMTEATFADEEVRALLMLIWAIGLAGWYKAARSQAETGRDGAPNT